jgi:hypothetical protein
MWHWQPVRQNGSARHCHSVGAPGVEGVAIAGGGLELERVTRAKRFSVFFEKSLSMLPCY